MKHSFSYFAIMATILMAVNSSYAMEKEKKDKTKKHPINKKQTQPQIESQLKLLFDGDILLFNEISDIKSLLKSSNKQNEEKKELKKNF